MSSSELADEGVDLPIARALVRLRFTLEHARRLAHDTLEPGVHIAIVALDGAVEHSLWLVTRAYGAQVKPMAARHEVAARAREALAAAGRKWQPIAGPAVEQLHRARNDAQHAALQFDPAQVADWSAAASAYTNDLILTAFDRPLDDVALADAVRDEGLGEMLRRAEAEIGVADPGAFQLICSAFDQARARWRAQQAHVYGRDLGGGVLADAFVPAELAFDDQQLSDLLDVMPFATDLGEYLWFVSSRNQHQQVAWDPDPADTRRALIFVSGWIVRWETFDRGYPLERWNEHFARLEPPIAGDDGHTTILELEASLTNELPGHPARCHLDLRLANVPDRARGPWGNWLAQAFTDASVELGVTVHFDRVQLFLTGQLHLVCELGYAAKDLDAVIRRGIAMADQRYRDWEADLRGRRKELSRVQSAFANAIGAAQTGHALFGAVAVTERGSDGQQVVWIPLNFGDSKFEELGLCVQGFQSAGGVLASTGTVQERLVFDAFELTPDNRARLSDAIARCEEIVLERRAYHAKRRLEFQEFRNELVSRFPNSD